MVHWIMMNIIQSRQIRTLECNMAIPELEPHFPSQGVVPEVELPGCLHVKFADEFP